MGKSIAIIDDDLITCRLMEAIIKKSGLDLSVNFFNTPKEGINHLEDGEFDYLFLDQNFRDLSGAEVLQLIPESIKNHLKVVVMSSNLTPENKQLINEYDFVVSLMNKPLTIEKLEHIIKE